MRSGVVTPGGWFSDKFGDRVVLRGWSGVDSEGGGGRWERFEAESMLARHRKHSPLPKKCGDGRGASERYAPKTCQPVSMPFYHR